MDKIIILKGNQEDNILEKLFKLREEEIEQKSFERTAYIEKNNLNDITENTFIEEINNITNLDETTKQTLIQKLDKLLENRNRIESFDCRTYYMSGIDDIINIIFKN